MISLKEKKKSTYVLYGAKISFKTERKNAEYFLQKRRAKKKSISLADLQDKFL